MKYIFLIGCLCMSFGMYFGAYLHKISNKEKQPEIKPCNCVSYKEYSFRQAKYEMYVDSIVYYCLKGNKKSALRVTDSVSKYTILLNF